METYYITRWALTDVGVVEAPGQPWGTRGTHVECFHERFSGGSEVFRKTDAYPTREEAEARVALLRQRQLASTAKQAQAAAVAVAKPVKLGNPPSSAAPPTLPEQIVAPVAAQAGERPTWGYIQRAPGVQHEPLGPDTGDESAAAPAAGGDTVELVRAAVTNAIGTSLPHAVESAVFSALTSYLTLFKTAQAVLAEVERQAGECEYTEEDGWRVKEGVCSCGGDEFCYECAGRERCAEILARVKALKG